MASDGITKALKAADELRRRWGAGTWPAEHLFELAGKNDVLVFRLALDPDVSALFVRSRAHKMSVIAVNTVRKNTYHQRFTLAHELGHLELHGDTEALVDMEPSDGEPDKPEEREANVFAAQLLAPLKAVEATLRSYGVEPAQVSDRLVIELARSIGVTHEVVLWRLKVAGNLSPDDVKHRIGTTDWDAAWRAYAPDAQENTLCRAELSSWRPANVSRETATQVSRLPAVYREMAFEAYQRREITAGKLAEVLGLAGEQAVFDDLLPLIDPELHEVDQALADVLRRLRDSGDD